jgi:shikimate kinase
VVWLTAPADVIRGRLAADPTTRDRRPALTAADPLAEVEAALAARRPLYTECADVAFDTGAEPPAAVTERIVRWLAAGGGDGR